MLPRKPKRTELLLAVTAVGVLVLVLAIPRDALVDIIAHALELDMTMPLVLIALVALFAVAAVGIGYGIGLQNSTEDPGQSEVLYRHRRAGYGRRRR